MAMTSGRGWKPLKSNKDGVSCVAFDCVYNDDGECLADLEIGGGILGECEHEKRSSD
jgi:hypothetical protein